MVKISISSTSKSDVSVFAHGDTFSLKSEYRAVGARFKRFQHPEFSSRNLPGWGFQLKVRNPDWSIRKELRGEILEAIAKLQSVADADAPELPAGI